MNRTLRITVVIILLTTLTVIQASAQNSLYQQSPWLRLQSALNGVDIVGLGEVGHGYESINEAKGVVVDFLRKQLGVKGVVFESSFTLSVVSYLRKDTLSDRLKYTLYPFWNTVSVVAAIQPFYQVEKEDRALVMGCDVQEDCRFTRLTQYLLNEGLVQENKNALLSADSILSYYVGKDFSRRSAITAGECRLLTDYYATIARELKSRPLPAIKQKLLQRSLENRQWLCRYLTLTSVKERMYYRDSLMAANVIWLKQELFAQEKIVFWAANTHVDSGKRVSMYPEWTGEWLSAYYKEAYGSLAFKKGMFSEEEALTPAFGIQLSSHKEKFHSTILLKALKKISAEQWKTPCE